MFNSGILSQKEQPMLLPRTTERTQTLLEADSLRQGGILIDTRAHGLCGGVVTAKMYLPSSRAELWPKLTNYSQWVNYFPNIVHSEVISSSKNGHRLYQVGRKAFMAIAAQVEIYLKVYEKTLQSIQFRLERGTFKDFGADLTLQDWHQGTLLTYTVQATPVIPVPSFLLEQGMRQDLPGNMQHMRRMLCC